MTRKNRKTNTLITIGTAEELMLCDGGGTTKWYTICEDHDCTCGHPSRKLAEQWFAHPDEWCDECAALKAAV